MTHRPTAAATSQAGPAGHRSRKAVHGYKMHATADADDTVVERLSVTPGNLHGGKAGAEIVHDSPGISYRQRLLGAAFC